MSVVEWVSVGVMGVTGLLSLMSVANRIYVMNSLDKK